jgi:integrase
MPIYKVDGQKKDGYQKYRVVVVKVDPAGKKRRLEKIVYGKDAAAKAEYELGEKISAGLPEPVKKSEPLTVNRLIERYLAEKKHDVRATTLAKKQTILRCHVEHEIGDELLASLGTDALTRWRQAMNEKPLGVTMKRNAYRELRALLNYAVEAELIQSNPIKKIKDFADPYMETVIQPERIRYYTREEFTEYAASALRWAEKSESLTRWGIYIFFMIAYYTGARKGEINALRWTDWDGEKFSITRSVSNKVKGTRFMETAPKNRSSIREIRGPEPLKKLLAEHKERQMKAEVWSESFRICGGPDCIPDTTLDKANRDIAEAAGLKRITIHEFRHSHASLLCNAGINIKEVARRLGHADVEITMKTYAHLYPQESERALAVLNGITI